MNCPYCGEVVSNQAFCPKCGNRLIDHKITTDYQISDNSELLMYIDKNAKKIMKRTFSIPTFFLGMYYFLYRKMYLLGLLFLLITIGYSVGSYFIQDNLSIYLFIGYTTIMFILNIVFSLTFNHLYVNHANRKISSIKKRNPKLTKFELEERIKYSGGTNILAPILALLIIIGTNSYITYKLFNQKDNLSNNTYSVSTFMDDTKSKLYLNSDSSFIWYDDIENEKDNYKVGSYKVSVGRKALMEIKVYNINVSRIKDINNLYLVELNINRIVKDGIAESKNDKYIYYGLMNNNNIELIGINIKDYYSLKKVNQQY